MASTVDYRDSQGCFSCVVDENPRFHLDALRWFASLTMVAAVDARDLVVNVVGTQQSEVLDYLREQHVTVQSVDPFDSRSPHCNKISGALRLAEEPAPGVAVLCDSDIVILDDPRRIDLPPGAVGGKVVDAPVPPLNVLHEVFKASGVPVPPSVPLPWGSGEQTVSGNSNGGLYLIPGSLLPRAATAWAQWAYWLLERLELLAEWSVYVDQVAMALALAAEQIETSALHVRWNTPTHDPTRFPSEPPIPSVIHYHDEVDRKGLIKLTGLASIDAQIETVNKAVRDTWNRARPQATYRCWLASNPRGHELQNTVTTLTDVLGAQTVVDVGRDGGIDWGDRSVDVTVVDESAEAFEAPGRTVPKADVVMCLEFPSDNRGPQSSRALLRQLWHSTTRGLVVRASEDGSGPAHQASQNLKELLVEVAPDAELYPVRVQGSEVTFVALRPPASKHPRDFGPSTLAPLVGRHPDPFGLLVLRLHALGTTNFYPDHAPRLWEYPVVAHLVDDRLPPGSRLIDVGAGVTPLAPFLSSRGYVVDTVDPSPIARQWPPQPDWNEWDFLDYGAVGLAHRSWNCALDEVPPTPPFDGVYSVSVIEHLPASVRRSLLADMARRTRPGGLVILTIDLVRGTDDLWNLNLGEVVEARSDHGTLDDVVNESRAVGLELFRRETVRDWGDSRVDIALLALQRSGAEPDVSNPGKGAQRLTGRLRGLSWRDLVRRRGPSSGNVRLGRH